MNGFPDFMVDMSDAELVRGTTGELMLPEKYFMWPAFDSQTDEQVAEAYWQLMLKPAMAAAVAKARKEWENGTD